MTRRERRDIVDFRSEDGMIDKANALAERFRGLWMILGWVVAILASVVTTLGVLKTDLGYATTAPGKRMERLEARVDVVQDLTVTNNRIIRALGADWCFRANDTLRAISEVNCGELTRGIRR